MVISDSYIKYLGDCIFYDSGSLVYLVKYIGEETKVTLPQYIRDYDVFTYAFNGNDSIIELIIPDYVTNIGDASFAYMKSLQFVEIGNQVRNIGKEAFYHCDNLNNIIIGESVTNIGSSAFGWCTSIENIVIPNSVINISSEAFNNCSSLEYVIIGKAVSSLTYSIFSNCIQLSNIIVDENNEYYASIDGNLYSKDYKTIIKYAPGKKQTIFEIPNFVEIIGEQAFKYSSYIQSVIVPNSVKEISSGAFSKCISLSEINIPKSVSQMGLWVFSNSSPTVRCEIESQPEEWNVNWSGSSNISIVWGYNANQD